jgi:hypothetical protein
MTKRSLRGSIGLWRTVYLDEDMRIFYAKNANKVDAKENLYVLTKAKAKV